jgi:hypothetical protein
MNISQQITKAFSEIGVNSVTLNPNWGTVRLSRREHKDMVDGSIRSTFKAELIEKGKTMAYRTNNPFTALAGLHAAVSADKRGTR